jgi:predicted dehydrogenase
VRITEEQGGPPYDLCLYNADSDTFDHGIATVLFENEVIATYTCNVVAGFTDRRMRVSGTQGTLDGSLEQGTVVLRKRDPGETVDVPLDTEISGGHAGADPNTMDAFLAFARGQAEPKCRPAEAAMAIRLGLAATRSSDQRRVVPMSEFAL